MSINLIKTKCIAFSVVAVLLSLTEAVPASDWPMFTGSLLHTSFSATTSVVPPLELEMNTEIALPFRTSRELNGATVVGDRAYLSLRWVIRKDLDKHWIKCVNAFTGELIWKVEFGPENFVSQPTVVNGRLYVQVNNHTNSYVAAFDANTGAPIWKTYYIAQWQNCDGIAVSNGMVVFNGGYQGGLHGIKASTGEPVWWNGVGLGHDYTPAIYQDTVYVFVNGVVWVIDIFNGELIWKLRARNETQITQRNAPVLDTLNRILIVVELQFVAAVDLDTRDTLWTRDGSYGPFWGVTPALYNGEVYAIEKGNLQVLDEFTGEELWRFNRVSSIREQPLVTRDYVFINAQSKIYAIDQRTNEWVWHSGYQEPVGVLTMANDRLYAATPDGFLGTYRSVVTDVDDNEDESALPNEYVLHQNYPNPFNPSTTINLALPHSTAVTLTVYNILGQAVRVLVDETLSAGNHSITWDGTNDTGRRMSSGVYMYRLTAGDFTDVQKMVLVK